MEKLDDFIEVDDNEIFGGDEHLKIQISSIEEKKKDDKDNPSKEKTIEKNDDSDLIDTDDYLNNDDEPDDKNDELEKKKVNSQVNNNEGSKKTENPDGEDVTNEFTAFALSLDNNGFFPDLEEEELRSIQSEEDLQNAMSKQLNTVLAQWQDQYKKNLLSNLISEGYITKEEAKNLPLVEFSEESIKGNIDTAKNVIREYYKRLGTVDKQVERIINSTDDLEESALELLPELKKIEANENAKLAEQLKQREELEKQRKLQFEEALKKNTFEFEEFIPGRKLQKKDKQEVFDNIFPVLEKINKDTAKYAPILAYLDKYGFLEGKFGKLINEAKTQSVSELDRILKEKKRTSGSNTGGERGSSKIEIDDSDVKTIYRK